MGLICIIGIIVILIMVILGIQHDMDQRDEYLNRIEKLKDLTKDK